MAFAGASMIQLAVLAMGDLFLLGLLVYKNEYLVFQTMVASQVFLMLLLLPFYVRGETKIDKSSSKFSGTLIAVLLFAVVVGLFLSSEDFWQSPSNFNEDAHLVLVEYADLLALVAVAVMAAALNAVGFLRGKE